MHKSTPILLALMLGACSPIVSTHGNMLGPVELAKIQPEISTRADVQGAWGPPTTVAAFDPNTWYYIGQTDTQKGIFKPDIEKRQVIRVTFGPDDLVTEVVELDPKLAQNIDPVDRKTPTAGKEYTALQQFIGNIGKFNPEANKGK